VPPPEILINPPKPLEMSESMRSAKIKRDAKKRQQKKLAAEAASFSGVQGPTKGTEGGAGGGFSSGSDLEGGGKKETEGGGDDAAFNEQQRSQLDSGADTVVVVLGGGGGGGAATLSAQSSILHGEHSSSSFLAPPSSSSSSTLEPPFSSGSAVLQPPPEIPPFVPPPPGVAVTVNEKGYAEWKRSEWRDPTGGVKDEFLPKLPPVEWLVLSVPRTPRDGPLCCCLRECLEHSCAPPQSVVFVPPPMN